MAKLAITATLLSLPWLIIPSFSFQVAPLVIAPSNRAPNPFRQLRHLAWSTMDTNANEQDEGVGAWIPIASKSALSGLGPQKITVMGLDLVVWEGANQSWSVLSDICPHRLAPLSQGRVDPITNCIECPYHGWQFDTNGTLSKIPQIDPTSNLETVRGGDAKGLPVHHAGDLLYAFLPSSVHGEMFPQSLLPNDMFPTLRDELAKNVTYFIRELPYSADFLIENFMDPAHIPFAHHSLQSLRSDGRHIPMTTVVSNFTHVELTFEDQSRGKQRDGVVSWQRPTMYHFRTRKEGGAYKTDLNIHIIPIKAGRSRVMFSSVLFPWLPDWIKHAASNRFLNTDTWLHDAERVARSRSLRNMNYVFASESDDGVRVFRQWWSKHGFSTAPPNTFGPAASEDLTPLSRNEQIDPWELHSKQCSSCRKALKNMKRVQSGGLVVSILSAILLRRWPIPATLLAMTGLYARHMAEKTATTIEGNPYRSGVADRSPAHVQDYETLSTGQRLRQLRNRS